MTHRVFTMTEDGLFGRRVAECVELNDARTIALAVSQPGWRTVVDPEDIAPNVISWDPFPMRGLAPIR